jgi:hypothetical protein
MYKRNIKCDFLLIITYSLLTIFALEIELNNSFLKNDILLTLQYIFIHLYFGRIQKYQYQLFLERFTLIMLFFVMFLRDFSDLKLI